MDEPARTRRLSRSLLADAAAHLYATDAKLAPWIERIGTVRMRQQRHQFGALCRSILSQQLGAGAATTIHRRFLDLFAPRARPDPTALLALADDDLRACGISRPKVRYLRAVADAWAYGSLRGVRLGRLDDDDVVARLTELPGVGVWTAEMFLLFSLGRPDVFSAGDLALCTAVRRLEERPDLTPGDIALIACRWAPYRSVASLYLWKIAHWVEDEP
jgi:DNA-3-methyladenine glycosylase II